MRLVNIISLLIIAFPVYVRGQYFQYSQYNFTGQRVNPATVSSSDYAAVGFIYRNQGTAADIHVNSSTASASYPFFNSNGKRWSGVGLSMMDDRSGGIFSVQEASLSYAINVFLSRLQFLSLGVKGLYQQRRVDLNGLYTGSQYILDRGFDESLFNGENYGLLKSNFMTFSAGLYWQENDRLGRKMVWWGVSFFDFNRPDDSFSGIPSQMNSTFVANAGIRLDQRNNISLLPEVLYTRSAGRNLLNVGLITSYEIRRYPNQAGDHVDLITKYVPGRSGILGVQLHRENFSVGFSYDFPASGRNAANRGAFEVAVEMRRLVEAAVRKRSSSNRRSASTRKKASAPATERTSKTSAVKSKSGNAISSDSARRDKALAETMPAKTPSDTMSIVTGDSVAREQAFERDVVSTLRQKSDSVMAHARAGRLSHEPFVIEKLDLRFNFEFNSVELDAVSRNYLDQLSTALKENAYMKVKLTGHTDNMGSPGFNLRLSRFRANVVRAYLISKGIEPSRIEAEGKGLTEPLNENNTEAERALNRRVELLIYYKD